ncbi:MAG TPA: MFS transporter [Alphaproteobacteria bacterium]|jgi:MFS family permease|nr:MFS transporter [Alphaproteobacteria bacterium]MDP6271708.1 MFS transporter [Alphaproteobacteria bacterium]HJM51608.1 MFS transporter [Alphaproteobacteria bacterium]
MAATSSSLGHDVKVMSVIGVAHGLSHFFQLVLPAVFIPLKAEFGLSFLQLGVLTAVLYGTSGISQAAAGFLVDRVGGRPVLVTGMALCGLGTMMFAFAPSYQALIPMAIVAGLGNSVFHPSDLSLLTNKLDPSRLGKGYAIHAFCGNLGWAVPFPLLGALADLYDWRTALFVAGLMGLCFAVYLVLGSAELDEDMAADGKADHEGGILADARLLTSPSVVLCFFYFALLAMSLIGIENFGVPGMMGFYGLSPQLARWALTGFLIAAAAGVLLGGFAADRTDRHNRVAMSGMFLAGAFMAGIASGAIAPIMVLGFMAFSGFFLGMTMPSRDMIVRKVTPPGKAGRVFGFVYSALDLGSASVPLILGYVLDIGNPQLVFSAIAILMILTIPTVMQVRPAAAARA